jgi:hypothetical protein
VRVPPGWRSAVLNSRPSYERRKRMDRGTRGHLLPTVGTDPTWTGVLACHTNKCGIFVASFILPPFRKKLTFKKATRSPKYNFDLLLL